LWSSELTRDKNETMGLLKQLHIIGECFLVKLNSDLQGDTRDLAKEIKAVPAEWMKGSHSMWRTGEEIGTT
jgi:hypothetical protein